MKIKIYKSLAMCTLLLGLAACNDFEEMNTDPYAPRHGKRHRFGVRQPNLRRTV